MKAPEAMPDRWHSLTILEQLGNIGSEVGRAASWKQRNDDDTSRAAFERALELFDRTLADERWRGLRRREIARAREVFCAAYLKDDLEDLSSLERYFMHFALAARADR